MDLSVIIPVLNEQGRIAGLIESLRNLPEWRDLQAEIIVVDGGSHDETLSEARMADHVISSAPGRGCQQNRGADIASGEVLMFLHADCELTPGCLLDAPQVLKQKNVVAGCFSQQITDDSWKYRLMEWGNDARVRLLQWAYGDQGIFISRSRFQELGGFPDVPLLEDWLISKQLSKLGKIKLSCCKIRISPRRWQKRGYLRQTLTNWTILTLAQCGMSPQRLARWYPHIR